MKALRSALLHAAFGLLAATALAVTPSASPDNPSIDLRFLKPVDLSGQIVALVETERRAGTAFVFLSTSCPISSSYVDELNRLAALPTAEQVPLLGVISDRSIDRATAQTFAEAAGIKFRVLFDSTAELAEILAPTCLPQAFVVSARGEIVYQGRIDDAVGPDGQRRDAATTHELQDAMQALSAGGPIAVAKTEPVGCAFDRAANVDASEKITFNRHIAGILFAHCAECHRPGEVAPFALLTYEDAAKRAQYLADVTHGGVMPPWKAEIGHGRFLDERRLTAKELAMIKTWATSGTPRGNEADLPPQPRFPSGWRLGTPDVVVEAPTTVSVPADGPDIFHHWVMPIEIPADKVLVGIEFKPGNAAVVHHAIIGLDTTGGSRKRDEETPEPGYRSSGSIEGSMSAFLGVWTPGMTPRFYPEDVGFRIPKQADVLLQLHLHPSGKVEEDRSRIALYFSDKPADKLKTQSMFIAGTLVVNIPPNEPRHKVATSFTLPVDLTLNSVFPHLHLIGKEVKVTATYPSGEQESLIWIKDWNFYWQDVYVYKEPRTLPKGTTIELEAYYDNSAENPFNPSKPPKQVLFGNDSDDEMCFILFQTVSQSDNMMMKLGPAMMMAFMKEWNNAKLTDAEREHIVDEASKLFGGGGRGGRGSDFFRRAMLSASKAKPSDPKPTEPAE
ncbi:MAG: redoxin domain-containing protein [Pirellulales bacterium]|nr:redoxin domain-containing protein [Pirellulales bacterium]